MTTPAVMSGKRATMRRATLLIPLVAVLGLTGCGGAQSQETAAPAPTVTVTATTTVTATPPPQTAPDLGPDIKWGEVVELPGFGTLRIDQPRVVKVSDKATILTTKYDFVVGVAVRFVNTSDKLVSPLSDIEVDAMQATYDLPSVDDLYTACRIPLEKAKPGEVLYWDACFPVSKRAGKDITFTWAANGSKQSGNVSLP